MSRARDQSTSITLGQMHSLGCRDLLVYCRSVECNHSITMNADHLPEDTLVRPLGDRMVCTKCGRPGADVRPDYSPHTNRVNPDAHELTRRWRERG